MNKYVADLINRYPVLECAGESIDRLINAVTECFESGNTLFLCGNGGSGADADHIAGEFLKGFMTLRTPPQPEIDRFADAFGDEGRAIAGKLQKGLRAVSLLSHPGFITAFCNDVDPHMIYAQQLYALAKPGDMVLGISTSGNAENIRQAFMVAKMNGVKTILLTGAKKGKCLALADLAVEAPEYETYKVQELHLPIYHTMCMAVEARFFGDK